MRKELRMFISVYTNGKWEIRKELSLTNCIITPRNDGGFDFIHEGHIQTYGSNCRFEIK